MAESHVMTATMVEEACITCGIVYYVPKAWHNRRRNRHDTFYCPNGHTMAYTGKSEADKLRDELAREKHRAEQAQARATDMREQRDRESRRASAARGQVTKIKNRVGKGVCPCCNRKFENLHRHMATKHPDWVAEPIDGDVPA